MIFSLILTLFTAISGAAPPATPTPKPRLPIIYSVKVHPICDVLHKVVMPFVVQEKKNNETFKTMGKQLVTFKTWSYNSAADIGYNGDKTLNGAKVLAAANIDQEAANTYQDLADLEAKLARSYRNAPEGKDPRLDSLRRRVDNIVKLQRAMVDRYEQQVGKTIDEIGATGLSTDPALAAPFRIPDYNMPNADLVTPSPPPFLVSPGRSDNTVRRDFIAYAGADQVYNAMMQQEVGFLKPALATVRLCDH